MKGKVNGLFFLEISIFVSSVKLLQQHEDIRRRTVDESRAVNRNALRHEFFDSIGPVSSDCFVRIINLPKFDKNSISDWSEAIGGMLDEPRVETLKFQYLEQRIQERVKKRLDGQKRKMMATLNRDYPTVPNDKSHDFLEIQSYEDRLAAIHSKEPSRSDVVTTRKVVISDFLKRYLKG